MAERVPYTVSKHALIPNGAEALAVQNKLTVGSTVDVEIIQHRDRSLSARANQLFQRLGEMQGVRVRNVRGFLAVVTGRADVVTLGNRPTPIPWGTGPRDMNAAEFEAFWTDAAEAIRERILPTLQPADREEIERLMETVSAA